MEKKTIGGFIGVLRKANGMTQKDLAEILNVSDKTVSRWERDESTPELALIPVIADLFHVSTDELLRGEKKSQEALQNEQPKGKSVKQVEHIIKNTKSKFLQKSLFVFAISMIGFLAAMICNFGLYRAKIGFFVAAVFYIAAIVCESIFFVGAWNSINGEEFSGEQIENTKKYFINLLEKVIEATLIIFAATLPLILNSEKDYPVYGILFEAELVYGLPCAFVTLVLCMVIRWKINGMIISKGIVAATAKVEKEHKILTVRTKHMVLLIGVILITFCVQLSVNNIGEKVFLSGTTFDNYEVFKSYMETPLSDDGVIYEPDDEAYYEEESIEDEDGNVLCQYKSYNAYVVSMDYGDGDDYLPITVYTVSDWNKLYNILDIVNVIFVIIYLLEMAGVLARFMIVRKKTSL